MAGILPRIRPSGVAWTTVRLCPVPVTIAVIEVISAGLLTALGVPLHRLGVAAVLHVEVGEPLVIVDAEDEADARFGLDHGEPGEGVGRAVA